MLIKQVKKKPFFSAAMPKKWTSWKYCCCHPPAVAPFEPADGATVAPISVVDLRFCCFPPVAVGQRNVKVGRVEAVLLVVLVALFVGTVGKSCCRCFATLCW